MSKEEKLLRALMGSCATSVWCVISSQWEPELAIGQIHRMLLKVAEQMNIDLNSESQLEQLRDEAVRLLDK